MIFLMILVILVWGGVETQLISGGNVAWNLTTRDRGVMTFPPGGSLTFTSDSGVPLVSCECRTFYSSSYQEPIIDLSRGRESQPYGGESYKAQYAGRGLDQGECGIHLSDVSLDYRTLTCRARAASGGWQEKSVFVLWEDRAVVPMASEARVVAAPGSNTTVLYMAGRPLNRCVIHLPSASDWLYFHQGHASRTVGRFQYHGRGLERGQCGVTITGATGDDSGVVWSQVRIPGVSYDQYTFSLLIVTAAPSAPELLLLTGTRHKAGDVMRATCTVRGGVPQATMSWYLGDKLLRSDKEDDRPDPSWKWEWESKTITQALAYRVAAADDGRELICRVGHLALKGTLEAKQKISVAG